MLYQIKIHEKFKHAFIRLDGFGFNSCKYEKF